MPIEFYEHQKQLLRDSENIPRVAIYHDCGLGKTYSGAEKMHRYGNNANLLICQKSKVNDWIEHFSTFYGDYTIKDLTTNKVKNNGTNNKFIGVINYDLAWRRDKLKELKDFTLMLDESSLITNPSAKRTKFVLKLNPKNVILLSGTPVAGKYERLWTQAKLLGWKITKKDFYERDIIEKELTVNNIKYPVKIVVGYKNVQELIDNFKRHGAFFLKTEEVLNLPEQIFTTISVNNTKEYREFRKERIIEFNDITLVGDNLLTKMLYERQLCSQYNKNKIQAFQDLLDSTEDRLIVFYNFTEELKILKTKVDRPYSEVNGEIKDLTNYENENNSITFVQYQAGAMGINLQKANKIIYFSLPLSVDSYMQSLKRIHRIGQKATCFYYILETKDSIDGKIYKALKKGENYTNELFRKDE